MDWFCRLTGFAETSYAETQRRLSVRDRRLWSDASENSYGVGALELASLSKLRSRRREARNDSRLRLHLYSGDVRDLHGSARNAGALFQVASQFNMLEMTGPSVTPEDGVTRYEDDATQGPACAIAAGAATIYRNYFVRVGDQIGQTANCQLDTLADLGAALATRTGLGIEQLWSMRNGYAMASHEGLVAIANCLGSLSSPEREHLTGLVRIGIHADVEVTDSPEAAGQYVSQVFCSALPLGYSRLPQEAWEPFARLVLEASYEATLHAASENADRSSSTRVFLTLVGAGAFGNPREWVLSALLRALNISRGADLDVFIVSHGASPPDLKRFVAEFEVGL